MAEIAGLDAFKENQEKTVIDASKKVKIGIIGTGWIAEAHVNSYKNMPDVEIVAMADLIPGKAEAFAEKIRIDDFAAAFVRLEGDIILDFRISWAMNMDTCGDALILGTKGGLRIPSTECWNGEFDTPLKVL